jgi:MFS family permease
MRTAVAATWALLLGIAFIMMGNGLQGSLLGIRAAAERFPTAVTGLVMSGYYIGFLAGSTLAPRAVGRVGHARVFGALASLASVAALIHAVFVDPVTWTGMRIVTGFCYAGLYIVAESWLNDRSTNETRGQLLSIYMVIQYIGLICGQFLLNLAPPSGFELFTLISILISLSVLPVLLTTGPAPSFAAPVSVGLRQLYRVSPLGVLGCLGVGLAQSAFFGMGAVYGAEIGLSVPEISLFMSAMILGGIALQWPVGRFSDRFDRRRVITTVTVLAAAAALGAVPVSAVSKTGLFALVCLFGGLSLPMYSLCVAHTNDFLRPDQMVAASSGLVLVFGIGAIFGPITVAWVMSGLGAAGFFLYLAAMHTAIGLFAVYRMFRRPAPPLEEQGPYISVPPTASPMAATLAPAPTDEEDRNEDSAESGSGRPDSERLAAEP